MNSRGAKIYVGHLHPRTTERDLYEIFDRYGRIYRIDLKHCYAFIDYNSRRDAEEAVHAMNGREVDGERIVVEWTRGTTRGRGRGYRPERSDYRVRIENLPEHAHWQDLKDYFRRAGDVIYGDINGTTGVIEFRYPEDVPRAIKEFDRTRWNGSIIYVEEDSSRRYSRRKRSRSPSRSSSRSRNHRRSRSPRKYRSKSRSRSKQKSKSRSPKSRSSSKRRSKSPSPSKRRYSKSRSPTPSKRRSKSQSPSKRRSSWSRSPSPSSKRRSKSRSHSRSPSPSKNRSKSPRTPSPSKRRSRSPRHSGSHSRSRSGSRKSFRKGSPIKESNKEQQNGEKSNNQEQQEKNVGVDG